jgi:pyridoxal 5'-phosphate synthase pdxT subunit
MTRIGVLALQGGFEAHERAFAGLPAEVVEVRRVAELSGLDGLVIPGGESSTLLNLMADEPWFDELTAFHARGGALMGTCAGAILLSKEVTGPAQESLGLLDARIARNAFGRQVDSFETTLDVPALSGTLEAVFIRAPRFTALGPHVDVLATLEGEPVMVRDGRVLALTFHPELTHDAKLHAYFVAMTKDATMSEAGATVPAGRIP